jgi:hypothetical protein
MSAPTPTAESSPDECKRDLGFQGLRKVHSGIQKKHRCTQQQITTKPLFKYPAFQTLRLHRAISIRFKHEHLLLHSKQQPRHLFHSCFQFLIAPQIPPALVIALLPRFYSGLSGPGAKLFDRKNPRSFNDTLKTADLDDEVHLHHPLHKKRNTTNTDTATRPPTACRSSFSKRLRSAAFLCCGCDGGKRRRRLGDCHECAEFSLASESVGV